MAKQAQDQMRKFGWFAYLGGAAWDGPLGKVSLQTLRTVEPFTRQLPKGLMCALVGGPWEEHATIPAGWVKPPGPSTMYKAGEFDLVEAQNQGVERLSGKGVEFAFETVQRGSKDQSVDQQCVIMIGDGAPSRPEYTSGHPWDDNGPGPSKLRIHLRADHVCMNIAVHELHQSLLRNGLPLAGAEWGCIDAFTVAQLRCGRSFDIPWSTVDHNINNMMWEWVRPETNRRRVIPAVFWGNLWCPSFVERLGVEPEELIASAYKQAEVAGTLRPLFSRLPDGTLIWTMTDGLLSELLSPSIHRKVMAAKRTLTRMLDKVEATMSDEPYVGPELPGLPGEST